MKSIKFFAILAACVLLFNACQEAPETPATTEVAAPEPAKPDLAQIKAEIQTIENAWAAAMNAGDVAALTAMYADDAISMKDGAPMLVGKAAIQQDMEKEFAKRTKGNTIAFETMDVYGDGNIVTEVGKETTKDASGKVVSSGKYVAIFEKRDGKYLCIREIYNEDAK